MENSSDDDSEPSITTKPIADETSYEDTVPSDSIKGPDAIWPAFLDFMLKDRPNLGSFLSLAYVASSSNGAIDLKFAPSNRFQFMEVTKKHNRDEIERLLYNFLNRKIDLHIAVETKKADADERQQTQFQVQMPTTINNEIENEPIIQTILDVFDGEILN